MIENSAGMFWLSSTQFEELVQAALDTIPDELWAAIDNVAVTVADWPTAQQRAAADIPPGNLLLGLYEGVPLTGRSAGYALVPPDLITIFRGPILQVCPRGNEQAVCEQVRRTVLHEIAHHFGISDERLIELGAY
jgi:predicted Zn-dependent protease with MMP-like domain